GPGSPIHARDPAERPDVEQQEDQRQRHDHRLGHEAEREGARQRGIASGRGLADVSNVGPYGQDEEEPAQDVFALRDPGDRFDAQKEENAQTTPRSESPPWATSFATMYLSSS